MATLKGIFPNPKPTRRKNFIQENVKNLRRMEKLFRTKEVEELPRRETRNKTVANKYRNVASRINSGRGGALVEPIQSHSDKNLEESHPSERRSSREDSDKRRIRSIPTNFRSTNTKDMKSGKEKGGNVDGPPTNFGSSPESAMLKNRDDDAVYKNQGIRSLDTADVGTRYEREIVRCPSSEDRKSVAASDRRADESSQRRKCPLETSNSSPDRDRLNKRHVRVSVDKSIPRSDKDLPPPDYRKGVVPKYIRDIKAAQRQRDEKIKAAADNPDCPEGHVPLPDEERKETLRMLKKHHQEYVRELNMMPIRTDTLRSQKRKIEIEKQLSKLEEGMKVFSRPKLYVRVDA